MGFEVPLVASLKLMWFLLDYGVIRYMSQECHSGANIKVAQTYSELLRELFSWPLRVAQTAVRSKSSCIHGSIQLDSLVKIHSTNSNYIQTNNSESSCGLWLCRMDGQKEKKSHSNKKKKGGGVSCSKYCTWLIEDRKMDWRKEGQ